MIEKQAGLEDGSEDFICRKNLSRLSLIHHLAWRHGVYGFWLFQLSDMCVCCGMAFFSYLRAA